MELKKQMVEEYIDTLREELLDLSHFIHDNPEVGLQEHQAVQKITELLGRHGLQVKTGICGLETAFMASKEGNSPGPHVAFLAEYDALAGIGHGCGHNIIATCAVGAFLGMCKFMDNFPGRVSLIGTPAEENFGSKCIMVDQGLFDDVDFAMMIHPSAKESLINRSGRAAATIHVNFTGRAAHSALPQTGINALSAVIALFNGIDQLRPVFLPTDNVNGIITEGGYAPNIIPGAASCAFCVRSKTILELNRLVGHIQQAAQAAALLVGAKADVQVGHIMSERYPNLPMSEAFKENMEQLGESMIYADPDKLYGSSDIGNVSIKVPVIHDYLCISTRPDINEHSTAFAEDAASPRGDEVCIKGAKGLAMTAVDLFSDAALREKARAYYKAHVPSEYLA